MASNFLKEMKVEQRLRESVLKAAIAEFGTRTKKEVQASDRWPAVEAMTLDPALALNEEPYVPEFGQLLRERARRIESPSLRSICNQVDDLIDDSAKLLDRCLTDRQAYERLSLERFRVRLELTEQLAASKLTHAQQNDADYWNFEVHTADKERAAFEAAGAEPMPATLPDPKTNTAVGNLEKAVEWTLAASNTNMHVEEFQRVQMRVPALEAVAAFRETVCRNEANLRRSEGEALRKTQAEKDVAFKNARLELSDDILFLKLAETVRPSGSLRYKERIELILNRASRDFAELRSKLEALSEGLTLIVGSVPRLRIDAEEWPLDHAVDWLRQSTNLYFNRKLREHRCVHRIVLRGEVLTGASDNAVGFEVLENQLPRNARLVGVSASAQNAPPHGAAFFISIPGQSTSAGTELRALKLRLGRVLEDHPARQLDIVGPPAITNRTPVGLWSVRRTDGGREQLVALIIDLHLVGDYEAGE